ncbi:Cof-type HAD-IIB family hydrolase [uncultured Faecalicoccus sp.]|uniref:Cof-type HAD-IIB family hydrolase n=1 Tax=uncultured Faecalicoccus sp. TaxID=1971760 RepID=UPI0025DB6AA9|nr:Cof-type HAD-IIB family hydrolase [uncultured Faecalicoccus sp.]
MIKAIFFDFDGTILSHSTMRVPASAKKALQALQKQGILVIVATGRHITEIEEFDFCHEFTFDAYITLNGQYCFNQHESIYSNPVPKEDVLAILEHIKEDPYPCVFVEKDRQYMNFYTDWVRLEYQKLGTSLPELEDIQRAADHDIYQLSPYLNDRQEQVLFAKTKNIKIDRWTDYVIDVLPKVGGKDTGIQKVLDYYGLKKEETMAFGDASNDIPMFQETGISVAMGNAKPEVKQVADYITDDIDQDGLAQALQHFQLIK